MQRFSKTYESFVTSSFLQTLLWNCMTSSFGQPGQQSFEFAIEINVKKFQSELKNNNNRITVSFLDIKL